MNTMIIFLWHLDVELRIDHCFLVLIVGKRLIYFCMMSARWIDMYNDV